MTHLDVYRCDRKRCQEEKPAEYLATTEGGPDGPYLPEGWLRLDRWRFGEYLCFCSLDCLAIWARAERAAMEGT